MGLEVNINNLYRNGEVLSLTDNDGMLVREPIDFKGTTEDLYHKVKKLDRLDLLANTYYRARVEDASKYWWVIADANNIENPLDLNSFIGTDILIPNIMNVLLKLQE